MESNKTCQITDKFTITKNKNEWHLRQVDNDGFVLHWFISNNDIDKIIEFVNKVKGYNNGN